MKNKNKIFSALKERHRIYLDLKQEVLNKDPYWNLNFPLKGETLLEWRQYGVNLIQNEFGYDQKKAEIEMSYLEMEYGSSSI
jgi:hypothetical protein